MNYSELKRIVEENGWLFYDHEGDYEIQDKNGETYLMYGKSTGGDITADYSNEYIGTVPNQIIKAIEEFKRTPDAFIVDTDNSRNTANIISSKLESLRKNYDYEFARNWSYVDQQIFQSLLNSLLELEKMNNSNSRR